MNKTWTLLVNPASTGYNTETIREINELLKVNDYNTFILESKNAGDITKQIQEVNGFSDFTSTIGGDGTLGEAFKGLQKIKQKTVLCPIPSGAANDLIVNYGLDKDPIETVKILLELAEMPPKYVDLVTFNGEAMGYAATAGLGTHIPPNTDSELKKRFGTAGYFIKAGVDTCRDIGAIMVEKTKAVAEKIPGINHSNIIVPEKSQILDPLFNPYTVTYRSNKLNNCILIAITNAKRFASFDVYPDANIGDGKFEVLLVKNPKNIFSMIQLLDTFANGKLGKIKCEEAITFSTDSFKFELSENLPYFDFDVDGDAAKIIYPDDGIVNTHFEAKVAKQVKCLRR